jgi:hypothetical protein
MSLTTLVLTSAGIAAIVSGLITLVGQFLERRARRQELLLSEALKLAHARTQLVLELVREEQGSAALQDDVFLAETYFQWLNHLLARGKLPPDAQVKAARSRARARSPRPDEKEG